MLPIACLVLMKWYPPEFDVNRRHERHSERAKSTRPYGYAGKKVLLIMGAMLVCWIAGNWDPDNFDTFLVGIAGSILMFMPGMNLFTWKEAQDATGWDTLLMLGAVSSLGAASTRTGLAKWIVDSTMGGLHGMGLIPLLLIISAFTVVIHLVIPVNPAIIAAIVPPMIILGQRSRRKSCDLCAAGGLHHVGGVSLATRCGATGHLQQGLLQDVRHVHAGLDPQHRVDRGHDRIT